MSAHALVALDHEEPLAGLALRAVTPLATGCSKDASNAMSPPARRPPAGLRPTGDPPWKHPAAERLRAGGEGEAAALGGHTR